MTICCDPALALRDISLSAPSTTCPLQRGLNEPHLNVKEQARNLTTGNQKMRHKSDTHTDAPAIPSQPAIAAISA